jgi:diacylglycerol kinase (ATP)
LKPGKTGLRRLVDATGYSWKGLSATWRGEAALRQEMLLVVVLLAASFWLAGNLLEWLALVLPLFVLLIVELLNSAIEAVVDRIGDAPHVLSGRAKDMGSAAVLISLLMIATAWGTVGWQHLQP